MTANSIISNGLSDALTTRTRPMVAYRAARGREDDPL